jgi:hypothetical protein
MKRIIIAIVLASALNSHSQSQTGLDSIFSSLNNNDLFIAPIVGGINIGIKPTEIDYKSTRYQKRFCRVSSLNEDINLLAEKYSKKLIAQKLFALLQDSERDLYAIALLCDLLDNQKLGKLISLKREEWISKGEKVADLKYWQGYLKKEKYLE